MDTLDKELVSVKTTEWRENWNESSKPFLCIYIDNFIVPESKFYRFLDLVNPAGTPFNMVLIFSFTYSHF
jgi:hypothetical protein